MKTLREKIFLLIYGNVLNYTGWIIGDLILQFAGLLMIIWALVIVLYDLHKIKKREKRIKQVSKELLEEFEEERKELEKLGIVKLR